MGRNRTRKRQQQQQPAIAPPVEEESGLFETRPFAAPGVESAQSAPSGFGANGHSLSRISPTAAPRVQAKLTVGAAHDPYEQQADQTAATVVSRLNQPSFDLTPRRKRKRQNDPVPLSIQPLGTTAPAQAGPAPGKVERSIEAKRGQGRPMEDGTRSQMEGAFGHDFSGVNVHTDGESDQLNQSLSSRAFTTGQDIFFRQGEYAPSQQGGQELLAHELTHVLQQNGQQIQENTSIQQQQQSPKSFIQCTPEDVWEHADILPKVTENDARLILKMDFSSNWFLAQQYLLGKDKWVNKHGKDSKKAETKLAFFKGLMKTLIKLRKKETDSLLTEVRQELKQKPQYATMTDEAILNWSSAGSESLTSDIDVNLKGAGSIEAVTLFNQYFKTRLGWSLDPGTVYDVNVYAQDFMTPQKTLQGDGDKPFVKEGEGADRTIAPVEEITELKSQGPTSEDPLSFDAFALNQDVWSLVKMRTHMTDDEWSSYSTEMIIKALGTGTPDEEARAIQVEEQLSDAEHYYREYQANIREKIDFIDHSQDDIYQNMRQALVEGSKYLSDHQQKASKKMIAANLIYQDKLDVVSHLRAELKQEREKKGGDFNLSKIKELGIRLKNALSEAIIYANEAYLTQGAVHFSVIGQQIGKGESKLLMSDEEHLHSFREQIGDTLKVLAEYHDESLEKAVLKAGKYIDRMAKSARPLINPDTLPLHFNELADIGAAAAKLKSDKTSLEDKNDRGEKSPEIAVSIGTQENDFKELLTHFTTIEGLRAAIIQLGQTVEADFRKAQVARNSQPPSDSGQESVPETAQVAQSLEDADSIIKGDLTADLQDLIDVPQLLS